VQYSSNAKIKVTCTGLEPSQKLIFYQTQRRNPETSYESVKAQSDASGNASATVVVGGDCESFNCALYGSSAEVGRRYGRFYGTVVYEDGRENAAHFTYRMEYKGVNLEIPKVVLSPKRPEKGSKVTARVTVRNYGSKTAKNVFALYGMDNNTKCKIKIIEPGKSKSCEIKIKEWVPEKTPTGELGSFYVYLQGNIDKIYPKDLWYVSDHDARLFSSEVQHITTKGDPLYYVDKADILQAITNWDIYLWPDGWDIDDFLEKYGYSLVAGGTGDYSWRK